MEQDGFQYFHSPNREKKTAVALEYEPTDQAPKQSDIPVHKDEKLAGSLKNIEIGEYIPPELYQVVADVLVFVDAMDHIKDKVMDHRKER